MNSLHERTVNVGGANCRIWTKGEGKPLGFIGGLNGVPRWLPFLERLSQSREVIVVSPPGFPGSDNGHKAFNGYIDWITATLDLLEAAGLDGADLVGASVGGLLAAEAAAFSPSTVSNLVLMAPFGIHDGHVGGIDPFPQTPQDFPSCVSADSERYSAAFGAVVDDDEVNVRWMLKLAAAADAASSILWPYGDRGLERRLHRIWQSTLLVWGAEDRVLPPAQVTQYEAAIAGPVESIVIEGAGHLVYVDRPDASAEAVLRFLDQFIDPVTRTAPSRSPAGRGV